MARITDAAWDDDFGVTLGVSPTPEEELARLRAGMPEPPTTAPLRALPSPPKTAPRVTQTFPWCDVAALLALAQNVKKTKAREDALRGIIFRLVAAHREPLTREDLQQFYSHLLTWTYIDSGRPRVNPHAHMLVKHDMPPLQVELTVNGRKRRFELFDPMWSKIRGTWPPCDGHSLVSGGGASAAGTKRARRATSSPSPRPTRRSRRLAGLPPMAA